MRIKCYAHGRLTRDPELRRTPSGTAVVKCGLASDYGWGDKKDTIFMDCVAFGKTAEIIAEYSNKGDAIIFEGELQANKWEDKEGNKKERIELKIDGFQFVSGNKKNNSQEEGEVTF